MIASDLFRRVALLLFTPQCFENYFADLNFTDVVCFKSTLSTGLSLGLILGSTLVKVPQILKIINNRSGQGINIWSVTLEISAIVIYMSYNFVKGFPFNSWGDTFFVGVQTLVIATLVLIYSGKITMSVLYVISVLIVCFILMSGLTPINILLMLTSVNIIIVVVSKLLQARTNYANGHTGQLSAATLILLLAGSSARIFTSIQETGDPITIATYVASTSVNALLVFQLIYYWNATEKVKKEKLQ
ncbi:mannose-P-dolichol utilization defect 1 protein homolog [Euwallacea fornicatus]|uniref:mannose-P-dolichol utilization defect 1 protein homolog n=1 Tax=Euwallacea fornicatus TaxID=995702 RepID=UPI00338EC1A2